MPRQYRPASELYVSVTLLHDKGLLVQRAKTAGTTVLGIVPVSRRTVSGCDHLELPRLCMILRSTPYCSITRAVAGGTSCRHLAPSLILRRMSAPVLPF